MKRCDHCSRTYCPGDACWLGGCVCGKDGGLTTVTVPTPLLAFQRCDTCAQISVPLAHHATCPHHTTALPECHYHTSSISVTIRKDRPIDHELTPPFGTAIHAYADATVAWSDGRLTVLYSIRPLAITAHTGGSKIIRPTTAAEQPISIVHNDNKVTVAHHNHWPAIKKTAGHGFCQTEFAVSSILRPVRQGYIAPDKRRGVQFYPHFDAFECLTCNLRYRTLDEAAAHLGETTDTLCTWKRADGRLLAKALKPRQYPPHKLTWRADMSTIIYNLLTSDQK